MAGTSAAASQAPSEPEPITCWWRTDRTAVHVGEQFTLILTCGIVENQDTRTVLDAGRLAPEALDLAPFEVLGGTTHEDLEAPPRRYLQRSYALRLIGDEFFGKDVDIPGVPITYRIETPSVAGSQGRDQVYILPRLPVRIVSLVPLEADDIEDWAADSFGDIERRQFRASAEQTAAGILFVFAAVFAGAAAMRALRPKAARMAAGPRVVPVGRVLRGCTRELGRLQSEVDRSGWTPELVGRALSVFRVAGSAAAGRPLAQRSLGAGATAQDGELEVYADALGARRAVVSGSATPATVVDPSLQELAEALRVFAAARYTRAEALDRATLDDAFGGGRRAVERIAERYGWRARAADAVSRAATRGRDRVWRR